VADTAEEDFYLDVVFTWLTARDSNGSKWQCRIGSGVSLSVILTT
jgi:hypothetical protein